MVKDGFGRERNCFCRLVVIVGNFDFIIGGGGTDSVGIRICEGYR